ncbi:type II toxin-antitoxin system VapC family toxin [Candidatus Poriferisocius sp.]|uniref:type II toxin-antitoxin system VapC family toxin n=1 Tax=Candidatus Poriferisocius sp. TaxID=3101276 RepID=UPI003B51795F
MAVVYFDASALVKLVVEESGSDIAAVLWDGCDAAVSSRIAYPEVRAALAAAGRNHVLDEASLTKCEQDWEEFWAAIRPVELTYQVQMAAGLLAKRHSLRGADAVHLASALEMGLPDLVVAVWDRRLYSGARAENLAVAPANLP